MTKPRLLDLFCGEGGAGMGYALAGWEVVGVDLVRKHRYPFTFHAANALTFPLDGFDFVHASPPCKAHTVATAPNRAKFAALFDPHVDLVEAIRARLVASGLPYVIENVEGAPLLSPIRVCGSSLNLKVRRHRLFESNLDLVGTDCRHVEQGPVVSVFGHPGGYSKRDGKAKPTVDVWREAMGMPWASAAGLAQAIPPAYTEYLGRQMMALTQRRAA